MSLLAMPNPSRSWSAFRTPSGVRPAAVISSSVDMPSSASASNSAWQMVSSPLRYSFVISAFSSRARASSSVATRREDGNTCTRFSSLVSSTASSSHATAVRTRVSSVAESRSNTPSSSSRRISPAVATTSPFRRFFRSRLRSARSTPWISRRLNRERADIPNCRSTSSWA